MMDAVGHESPLSEQWNVKQSSRTALVTRTSAPAPAESLRQILWQETIALDVIPRLVRARRGSVPPPAVIQTLEPHEIEAFTGSVLSSGFGALDTLHAMLARGISAEAIYLDLLAPSARYLGELWLADRCGFADVTIAANVLRQLMSEIGSAFHDDAAPVIARHEILLLPAPGDQHTLGLAMVAAFFRRAGWAVRAGTPVPGDDAEKMVERHWFSVVGFSVGNERKLEAVSRMVAAIRRGSMNPAIVVMVGGPAFDGRPDLVSMVGADATAADARRSPRIAEDLVATRGMAA